MTMFAQSGSVHSAQFDVFNGDADGLCALQQFRLLTPASSHKVTGIKRDICLLDSLLEVSDSVINVFDISFDSNCAAIHRLLEKRNSINYFDHHAADQQFAHPQLKLHWNPDSQTCTSLLVYEYTAREFPDWALVGCFGDGLDARAQRLAEELGVRLDLCRRYCELGRLINYNAYGEQLEDLHFSPYLLAEQMRHYRTVDDFIHSSDVFSVLQQGYASDMHELANLRPEFINEAVALYILPDSACARRLSGSLANKLRDEQPGLSLALLSHTVGGYRVSIRSANPLRFPAAEFAKAFATGGGRAAAAGINVLPINEIESFSQRFIEHFANV